MPYHTFPASFQFGVVGVRPVAEESLGASREIAFHRRKVGCCEFATFSGSADG